MKVSARGIGINTDSKHGKMTACLFGNSCIADFSERDIELLISTLLSQGRPVTQQIIPLEFENFFGHHTAPKV